MKTKLLLNLVLLLITFNMFADLNQEETRLVTNYDKKVQTQPSKNWNVFLFCISPNYPETVYNSNVYGLKMGIPVSGGIGTVAGVEMSLLASTTSHVAGVQLSPFANIADDASGFQLCAFTNATDDFSGMQMSMINVSDRMGGFQLGAVNVDSEELNGMQMGFLNYSESSNGFQLGVVNIVDKRGVQFGLINIIDDSWLSFCPLMNISF